MALRLWSWRRTSVGICASKAALSARPRSSILRHQCRSWQVTSEHASGSRAADDCDHRLNPHNAGPPLQNVAGSNRPTEHRVLPRPLGRSIAQPSDGDAARQSSLDGCLHEFGREERERDRHIDLSNAAFIPRSDLLDTGRCRQSFHQASADHARSLRPMRSEGVPDPPLIIGEFIVALQSE
jgi:hypothetical protein